MPERSLVKGLKERKFVQWVLAYSAGAWLIYEATGTAVDVWDIPLLLVRTVHVLLIAGLFITLVIAWYHGEKGRQKISGPELLMVAALLVVAGAALTLVRRGLDRAPRTAMEGDERPGIAVFPCENWSADPHDAYFASGIHDEILLQLSRIRALRSIGRESMEWHVDNPRPMRQIAEELAVGYLAECSVRKDVDRTRIRLTFQLLDGNTGAQIWAENYDADITARSILDIHTDVARRVARAVGAVITPEEDARLAEHPTENTLAYREYLVGRSALRRRTQEGLRTALRHFERALEADSMFALAYVGLADTYSLMYSYTLLSSSEAWPMAQAMAARALVLDGTLGEAYASLGFVQMRLGWDYESAFSNYTRAVELNPGYTEAYFWHAVGLTNLGRVDEAEPLFHKALELDPLNFNIVKETGRLYTVTGKYDRALEELERAMAMNPEMSSWTLAQTQILAGRYDEGLRNFEMLASRYSAETTPRLGLAWGLAVAGRMSESREILEAVLGEQDLEPVDVALVYVALGELDPAFEWLDRAYTVRSLALPQVIAWPHWDRLRADPRFQTLMEKIGIPQEYTS
jgi:adenylate cyclase